MLWSRGSAEGPHDQALNNRVIKLKSELKELEQMEKMLDQQKFWVEQSIRNTTEDCNQYPLKKKIHKNVVMCL